MLRCNDGSYYVGHTEDLEVRMGEYKIGNLPTVGKYVSKRLPVELVWCDTASTRYDAVAFERQLKGWSRKKKEALITGGWEAVKEVWKQQEKYTRTDPSSSDQRSSPQDERNGKSSLGKLTNYFEKE